MLINHSPPEHRTRTRSIYILGFDIVWRRPTNINSRGRTTSVNYRPRLQWILAGREMRIIVLDTCHVIGIYIYLPIFDLVTHVGFININYYIYALPNSSRNGHRKGSCRPWITYSDRNRAVLYYIILCVAWLTRVLRYTIINYYNKLVSPRSCGQSEGVGTYPYMYISSLWFNSGG